ncbi:MAG: hypothetical protein GOMPHAMPRED_001521 [Gomphillus americanus]|uniref:ribonuclease T1 n=1 Tax=Gomphillus americanus TaxID=1940652 RepID=A0A8H3F362_9LECA|nr:MAG: hypothetical protein GOMPHAMPRED_001521 [Gomphillus americanus]
MVALYGLPIIFSVVMVATLPAPLSDTLLLKLRQSDGATCGSHQYNNEDISNALNAGCNYLDEDETVGNDDYYNDYEGFDFSTSSPWYEFPILADHDIFDGSTSPGADRVIFNGNCQFTAVIMHTGASNDDFNECDF